MNTSYCMSHKMIHLFHGSVPFTIGKFPANSITTLPQFGVWITGFSACLSTTGIDRGPRVMAWCGISPYHQVYEELDCRIRRSPFVHNSGCRFCNIAHRLTKEKCTGASDPCQGSSTINASPLLPLPLQRSPHPSKR
jgi:hypothetical protein